MCFFYCTATVLLWWLTFDFLSFSSVQSFDMRDFFFCFLFFSIEHDVRLVFCDHGLDLGGELVCENREKQQQHQQQRVLL